MTSALEITSLTAIDVHVHCEVSKEGRPSLPPDLLAASEQHFGPGGQRLPQLDQVAAYYRERHMACVVFTVDAESTTGYPAIANEEVAEAAAAHPDVLIPFASIDPAKGRTGVRAARRLVEEHQVRGFKFHPNMQAFFPNDRKAYPLYEALRQAGFQDARPVGRERTAPPRRRLGR